ncbi:MAG: glycoside hydrolase family 57 [Patescibacteria group bacterium]
MSSIGLSGNRIVYGSEFCQVDFEGQVGYTRQMGGVRKGRLELYTVFHLNILYSSIPEKEWPVLVEKCYWPLLHVVEELNVPLGIEAPGYTLEQINKVDSSWVSKLKELLKEGKCEFVGSGYAQIIGPLVPAEVNQWNLRLGNEVYQSFLSRRPSVAYVNEQTYSQGLVQLYKEAGFKALVMEWENPHKEHPEWKKEWQYHPQYATDQVGAKIPLIWNQSIAFQKFQRYVHGELELDEYMDSLATHKAKQTRFFPLYGNDAEIFDYRPGRYHTEGVVHPEGEWNRIRKLFAALLEDSSVEIVFPSQVLHLAKRPHAFHELRLDAPGQPIPVKKQEKYTPTRWALAGRDNLQINSACYRILKGLKRWRASLKEKKEKWKELCFLWSSDFRTHIEEQKFQKFQKSLRAMLSFAQPFLPKEKENSGTLIGKSAKTNPRVSREQNLLTVETASLQIVLNRRRGLAVDSAIFKKVSRKPLVGTLHHGYYEDIHLGADFYTGHTIIEMFGKPKITDLEFVEPEIAEKPRGLEVKGTIKTPLGTIAKIWLIPSHGNWIELSYEFELQDLSPSSFVSGIVTLHPEAFLPKQLFYSCKNGGEFPEVFSLKDVERMEPGPVSFLVSSSSGLGNTAGQLEVGDREKVVRLTTDMATIAAIPRIHFVRMRDTFFFRVLFSLGEVDDTNASRPPKEQVHLVFPMRIEALKL